MGAGNLDYRELSQLMEMRTGGMSVSTHVTTHHSDLKAFEQVLWAGVGEGRAGGRWGLEGYLKRFIVLIIVS